MPLGSLNQSRDPRHWLLSAPMAQTLNICDILRYFSMMPLQLSSPKPWEV